MIQIIKVTFKVLELRSRMWIQDQTETLEPVQKKVLFMHLRLQGLMLVFYLLPVVI